MYKFAQTTVQTITIGKTRKLITPGLKGRRCLLLFKIVANAPREEGGAAWRH